MTNENKELIATFDGWVKTGYHRVLRNSNSKQLITTYRKEGTFGAYWLDKMPYDKDWNWIMGVWKKIQKVWYNGHNVQATISENGAVIYINENNNGDRHGREIANTLNINYFAHVPEEETSLEESIGIAIIRFINWYNENVLATEIDVKTV